MALKDITTFITGFCLFILGMHQLSTGLHNTTTFHFKNIINNYKLNPLLGIIIGGLCTALLQSSSGTTVIVVGLVDAQVLNLYQATSIIMGANIGTTITGQLIALDISRYLSLVIIFGLVLIFCFRKKYYSLGIALIGFSLIFIGIDNMRVGIEPLQNVIRFQEILSELRNSPSLGLLMGFLTTAIIQSSSTGIAILQSLSSNSLITLKSAIAILIGLNIGTCVTTLLSSIALNISGKRAALIHLLFNLLGALLIFPFINLLCNVVMMLSPINMSQQIAHAHTLFNVISTIIFLPFITLFVKLACKIIKK
ncbi:Na/Pi cotransporter family protein [Serpentinicella alkaliphila]|uniref:Phosphate:Na+ symporter n=1 Tax=Serpentinicella alkaliphila TaxID=1734049 RepID=A0A4R2U258_9FIRM|nr:Na/Pi symporter [Serpentinicella alkaliphila]TCQ04139.1 phosphate:Na+ symporter [Serpentinicella alkaliphila]